MWKFRKQNAESNGQCYNPSERTEDRNKDRNKGLVALFSGPQGRWIDYDFKSEITRTGSLSTISSIV